MQANTEQKQTYLREEIFPTYDPQEFVEFLKTDLKIQELDVDALSMDTIKASVLKFKQYKYYQNEESRESTSTVNPNKPKKIHYERSVGASSLYDYEFEQKIKCLHADSFSKVLEPFIPKVEVVQTEGIFLGLGSKTQVWYVIKTNMDKHPVRRLEEDFQWLSNVVLKLHPLQAVPELIGGSADSEDNYEKRRKELEQYLQILAGREEMKRSSLFYQFLTFPAEKMDKMKKNYQSMNSIKTVHSLQTDSGYANLTLTNKVRNYAQTTIDYMRKAPKTHQNISDSIAKVMQLLQDTSKQIYKIVDYFAQLHQFYNQVTNKSPEFKVNEYSQSLININNLFHIFANDLVNRSNILNTNLKQFSKISINYDKSIYKLYKNLHQTEKDYLSFKSSLNRKKERIYPQIGKWEVEQKLLENRRLNKEEAFQLMLPKETQQQNQQKKWLAYLYSNYKNQYKTYLTFEVKRYFQVYCTFSADLLLSNKTYVEEISKFIDESKKLVLA